MRLYEITFRHKEDTMTTEVKAENEQQTIQRLVNYYETDEILSVEDVGEITTK